MPNIIKTSIARISPLFPFPMPTPRQNAVSRSLNPIRGKKDMENDKRRKYRDNRFHHHTEPVGQLVATSILTGMVRHIVRLHGSLRVLELLEEPDSLSPSAPPESASAASHRQSQTAHSPSCPTGHAWPLRRRSNSPISSSSRWAFDRGSRCRQFL